MFYPYSFISFRPFPRLDFEARTANTSYRTQAFGFRLCKYSVRFSRLRLNSPSFIRFLFPRLNTWDPRVLVLWHRLYPTRLPPLPFCSPPFLMASVFEVDSRECLLLYCSFNDGQLMLSTPMNFIPTLKFNGFPRK